MFEEGQTFGKNVKGAGLGRQLRGGAHTYHV